MAEINFHPDFLAAQSRPIAPGSSLMPVLIIAIVVSMLTLSIFCQIDVLINARGRIIPNGKIKMLRAAQSGLVTRLAVRDGQIVAAGDLLVAVDDRSLRAESRVLSAELDSVISKIALYKKINGLTLERLKKFTPGGIDEWLPGSPDIQGLHREWLSLRLTSLLDTINGIDRDRVVMTAERQYEETFVLRSAQIEPLVKSTYEAHKSLVKNHYIARHDNSENEIKWHRARYATIEYRHKINLLDARINALEASAGEIFRQFLFEVADQRQALDLQRKTLPGRIAVITAELGNSNIISPISGIVENLSIAAEGVYVSNGDALLSIVPIEQPPLAEVMISSRDVGFIRIGQSSRIKIDAFPFTRYGSLPGKLIYLSSDAVKDQDTGDPAFVGHILLEKEIYNTPQGKQAIQIGMSLQVEIVTDERSLIDYFIAPVKQALSEALHER